MEARAPINLPSAGIALTDGGDGRVTFIGTATTLIRVGGFTVLTDPNFLRKGQRAYVGMGMPTRRLTEPAMTIGQLPPLDLIVLSHHHGDHFDRIAAAGLDKELPIVIEAHAAQKLRSQGFHQPIAPLPLPPGGLPQAPQRLKMAVATPLREAVLPSPGS